MVAEEVVDGGGAPCGAVGASEPPSDDGAVPGLDESVVVERRSRDLVNSESDEPGAK